MPHPTLRRDRPARTGYGLEKQTGRVGQGQSARKSRFTVGRAISSPGFSIQSLELWSFGVWDLEFFFCPLSRRLRFDVRVKGAQKGWEVGLARPTFFLSEISSSVSYVFSCVAAPRLRCVGPLRLHVKLGVSLEFEACSLEFGF